MRRPLKTTGPSIFGLTLLFWVAIFVFVACGKQAPHLLGVGEIRPTAAEPRDELHVSGEGFVEGARATITFDGITHRVGEAAEPLRVEATALSRSRTDLEIRLTREFVDAFLGDSGNVHHATFRGRLEVAFAPRTQGAPPITGEASDVELDFFATPEFDTEPDAESSAGHEELLERYGWTLERSERGALCVASIDKNQEVGPLATGDCIVQFEGVNVLSALDLSPKEGSTRAAMTIVRPEFLDPIALDLDVAGLRPQPPRAWHWTLVAVAIVAAFLVLCRSPLAMGVAVLETSIAQAMDPRIRRRQHALRWSGVVLGSVPFICISALFGAAYAQILPAVGDFDLLLAYAGSAALLCLAQVLGGGRKRRGWSVTAALSALVRGSAVHLTVLVAVGTAILQRASISIEGAAADQGAALWEFGMFRSVGSYLSSLALLCGVSLLAVVRFGEGLRTRNSLTQLLVDTGTWGISGLFVVVYLGGPNVPLALSSLPVPARAVGLAVLQLKLTAMFIAATWLRSVLPRVPERVLTPVFWRWLLPLTVMASLADLIWVSGTWPVWMHQANTWALLATTLLLILALCLRLVVGRRAPIATASVNPWL